MLQDKARPGRGADFTGVNERRRPAQQRSIAASDPFRSKMRKMPRRERRGQLPSWLEVIECLTHWNRHPAHSLARFLPSLVPDDRNLADSGRVQVPKQAGDCL